MEQDWNAYLCNVNGKVASILVDLRLRAEAPQASRPHLLWLWLYMIDPCPDGLHNRDEATVLYTIADRITDEMEKRGVILSGRISTEGRWEMYFYGEREAGFPEVVREQLAAFPEYRFAIGAKRDDAWDQYLTLLYPSPENLQRILNQNLLALLRKQGDAPDVVRTVEHFLYFPTPEARDAFTVSAIRRGFRLVENLDPEPGRPFGVNIAREQAVQQALIDQTSIELYRLATECGGEYDGWGTHVQKR